jgi:predicted metal-dependent phosphoesterase TrpH
VATYARQARLDAFALTDHDTLDGARQVANWLADDALRFVPGLELSCEYQNHEIHVLGLFVRFDHDELNDELQRLCDRRRERFHHFLTLIHQQGIAFDPGRVAALEAASPSLGRRHIADLLEQTGHAPNRPEAWRKYVGPLSAQVIPKHLVPVARGAELIHAAGGIAVLAHPPMNLAKPELAELKTLGLDGLESRFPAASQARTATLKQWAKELDLCISGGSDCHGPSDAQRQIGSCGLRRDEWTNIQNRHKDSARRS